MKPVRLLLLLSVVLTPASAVGADCLYQCEGSVCYLNANHYDFCMKIRAECQAKCSGQMMSWGAIAYSAKDKGAGWSYGFGDLTKAKKQAMDNCSKRGEACKLWVWYNNSCGAIAQDGKIVTWGTASVKEDADRRALQECRKAGGSKCAVEVSQCSR